MKKYKIFFLIHLVCILSFIHNTNAQNILIKLDLKLSYFKDSVNEVLLRKKLIEEGLPWAVKYCQENTKESVKFYLEGYHTSLPKINTKLDIIIKDTILKDTFLMDFFRVYEFDLPKNLIPNYEGNTSLGIIGNFQNTLYSKILISITSNNQYFSPFHHIRKNISKEDIRKKSFFRNVVIKIKGNKTDTNIIHIINIIDKRCAYTQNYYAKKHENKQYFNYYIIYESEKAPKLNDLIEFDLKIEKKGTDYQLDIITDPKKVDTFFHKDIDFKEFSSFKMSEEVIRKSSIQIYQKIGVITGLILNNVGGMYLNTKQ